MRITKSRPFRIIHGGEDENANRQETLLSPVVHPERPFEHRSSFVPPFLKTRLFRYATAVAVGLSALMLQAVLGQYVEVVQFLLIYPAVFLAAWLCGFGAGILCTGLCALGVWYWFLPPYYSFELSGSDIVRLSIFSLVGLGAAWMSQVRTHYEHVMNQAIRDLSEFKFALDQASIVTVSDGRGRLTYVNEKFCEISKYSREEVLGEDSRFLSSNYHSKAFFDHLWEVLQQGRVWKGAMRNRSKDGGSFWVNTCIVPFMNSRGRPFQFLAIHTDITGMKEAERERERILAELQEAVRTRDHFMALASHELRTPLTSLKLHAQMARRVLARDAFALPQERVESLVRQTEKQVKRLDHLVDDMLEVTRLTVGKLQLHREQMDLAELVRDVLKNHALQIEESGSKVYFSALEPVIGDWDRDRLEQVVSNLLTNALKYGERRPISITTWIETGKGFFEIRDQGVGIAEADQERIFERFERAISENEVSGLGIGLYISREITKAHGGEIRVESAPTRGATFTVELPLKHTDEKAGTPGKPGKEASDVR